MGQINKPGAKSGKRPAKKRPPPAHAGVARRLVSNYCVTSRMQVRIVYLNLCFCVCVAFHHQALRLLRAAGNSRDSSPGPSHPPTQPSEMESASKPKLSSEEVNISEKRAEWNGHRIVDIVSIFDSISAFAVCKLCSGKIQIFEKCFRGQKSIFTIQCTNCDSEYTFTTAHQ